MEKRRMISIDSSTKKSAYAVFDDEKYINSELIMCKEKDMDNRFKSMSLNLLRVLAERNPDVIYIEDTVVPRNVQTQRFLTRLQGVVYTYCITHNCEFYTIRPTVWRKLVGIKQGKKKREELKKEAIQKVKELFNMNVNDDEAEAVLIGLAAINQKKESVQKKEKRMVKNRKKYVRKTQDEYQLLGDFGYGEGWEYITAEKTMKEAKERMKEYLDNEPNNKYKIVKKRVKIDQKGNDHEIS